MFHTEDYPIDTKVGAIYHNYYSKHLLSLYVYFSYFVEIVHVIHCKLKIVYGNTWSSY